MPGCLLRPPIFRGVAGGNDGSKCSVANRAAVRPARLCLGRGHWSFAARGGVREVFPAFRGRERLRKSRLSDTRRRSKSLAEAMPVLSATAASSSVYVISLMQCPKSMKKHTYYYSFKFFRLGKYLHGHLSKKPSSTDDGDSIPTAGTLVGGRMLHSPETVAQSPQGGAPCPLDLPRPRNDTGGVNANAPTGERRSNANQEKYP